MSRIGKAPIAIPKGVEVMADREAVRVKGPKGELASRIPPGITVSVADGQVRFARHERRAAAAGLSRPPAQPRRQLRRGRHEGLLEGPRDRGRRLQGRGQGQEPSSFRSATRTRSSFAIPDGIAIALDAKAGKLTVSGADRQKVGQTAAEIRKLRVPDPYKAKGIKYANEIIRRKVGKAGGK